MKGKCHVCDRFATLESVTVRVYRKTTQVDYKYRPCPDCRQVLMTFLGGSALAENRSLFDHTTYNKRIS